MKRVPFLAVLSAVLAGCTAPATEPTAPPPETGKEADRPAPGLPGIGSDFGLGLYRQLGARERNLFFSPVSIKTAFGLAHAGARGETAAQIARTVNLGTARDQGALLRALPIDQPGRKLAIANALWVQRDYPLKAGYRRAVEADYAAAARSVNFKAPVQAVGEINRWVERNTAGRIQKLIDVEGLDPDVRLILTNTVYFKADWLKPFKASGTRVDTFFAPGGKRVQARFMHQRTPFRLLETPGFQALELPYKGEEMAMILFLPRARDGLPGFERGLTAATLQKWVAALRASEPRWVELTLPKLELNARYDLVPPLNAMGMVLPFADSADFSGMTDAEALKIDRAVHQTFLLVDEKGTEAAAATGLEMVPVSLPPPAVPFRADHPFFLMIRDNRSGTILFMGRIETPGN